MWIALVSFILFSNSTIIQEMARWVESQFSDNAQVDLYIFEGDLAEHIPFVMVLGRSESEIIGVYRYQSKSDPYYLYGDVTDQKISLIESSAEGGTTGHIFGTLDHNYLEGHWTNYTNEHPMPFKARPVADIQHWQWPESNHWIKQFYGQFSGRNVELLLHKEHDYVRGTLFSATQKRSFFLNGSCTSDSCNQVILEVFDDDQNYIGDLSGQFFQKDVIFVNYQPVDAPSAFYSLPIKKSITIESNPTVTFQMIQDFSYPDIEGLDGVLKSFYRSKSFLDTISNLSTDPPERLKTVQNGWIDLHWMNTRILTASMIYQDNVQDTIFTEIINYDLKKQEIINIDDLFRKKSKYRQIINKHVKQRLKTCDYLPCSELEPHDFKHIGLMKEGFLITTNFDILHGQLKWIIPYDQFDKELSKGTIMNFYYKPK